MTPGPVVMLVEDNTITRTSMRRSLENAGFAVIEAPDGKSALEQAETSCPALIAQDMHLPDIDGFDLLEALRRLPGIAEIPIIAVTGSLPERTNGTAQFNDVLIKPVEPSRLVRVINALLAVTEVIEDVTQRVRRRVLLAEDDLVQRKVLRLHLGHWGFDVIEASNGAEALELAIATPPDIVVSDLLMPELDGLSLCVSLRRDPLLADVPLVLVSSYHVDEIDRRLATHSGATAIVSRSHDMAELGEALDAILRRDAAASSESAAKMRSTRDDIVRLVARLKRDADVRDALAESQAAVSALLPFFERFSDVGTQSDVDKTIDELLAGYLDASGAALGCAFLATTTAGLTLRSHLGFRDPVAAAELPAFFGRIDLLYRALGNGAVLELPSPEIHGTDIDEFLRRTTAVSMILVPLTIRGEHLGVLALGSRRTTSSTDRLRLAEAARGPIAQALALSRSVGELVTSRQAFRGIVDSTSDGIIVADRSAKITYANPAARQIFGYAADELVGRATTDIMPFLEGADDAVTGVGLRRGGEAFSATVTPTTFEDAPGHMLRAYLVRDLSLRETLDKLAVLANRDGLTDLFNRRRFDEHVAARIGESIRYNFSGALVMVDLDDFKAINDTYGHTAGDAVLKAVAAILRAGTRASDFTARLGGDEFAVELPHIHLNDAVAVATKLLAAVRTPIDWRGKSLQIGMSVGIAMYPDHGTSLDALVETADAALYRAKDAGRNRIGIGESSRGFA